ncbi:MAG: hypothetical protein LAQ30_19315 [Acidobacteriia bacterium]|nr:hypothetical protein [Terriglobia bacterium]
MRFTYGVALAALVFAAGCGRQEKAEGLQLSQALTQKQGDFNSANAKEAALVENARAVCAAITTHGTGRGTELAQNAGLVNSLAGSAVEVSTHLSQVRQAISDLSLSQEYTQGIRAALNTELTRRQRFLQDVRSLLEQSATDFLAFQKQKDFKGETIPDGITKLDAVLQSYKAPPDTVGSTLAELKTKYGL